LNSSLLVGGGAISCKTSFHSILVGLIGADALSVRAISMINCVNGLVEKENIGGYEQVGASAWRFALDEARGDASIRC
jgi:hypothetical protein